MKVQVPDPLGPVQNVAPVCALFLSVEAACESVKTIKARNDCFIVQRGVVLRFLRVKLEAIYCADLLLFKSLDIEQIVRSEPYSTSQLLCSRGFVS